MKREPTLREIRELNAHAELLMFAPLTIDEAVRLIASLEPKNVPQSAPNPLSHRDPP